MCGAPVQKCEPVVEKGIEGMIFVCDSVLFLRAQVASAEGWFSALFF